MNPLSRAFATPASSVGFYGCDAALLADLKPGNKAYFHVHFSLDDLVTGTSRREEAPVG